LGDRGFEEKRAVRVERLLAKEKAKEITVQEDVALRQKLRAEQRAAKLGFKVGVREERARITDKFRKIIADTDAVRKEIVDSVKESLPLREHGKFIRLVEKAKSQRDLTKAHIRIDRAADIVEKKSAITQIKKRTKNILKSKKIDVDIQNQIKDFLDDFELVKRRESTIKKLRATKEFVDRKARDGENVELPKQVIDALRILSRTSVDVLDVAKLESIIDRIDSLEKVGKIKLRSRRNLVDFEKERIIKEIEAQPSTQKFTEAPKLIPLLGKKAPVKIKLENQFRRVMNFQQHIGLSIAPMDVVFDLFDGSVGYTGEIYKNFKARTDINYSNYLEDFIFGREEIWALADKLKLNDQNFERIGVFAADQQEGGRKKLLDTGLTDAEIDAVILTENETKLFSLMRKRLDQLRTPIAKMMKEVYNESLGKVKNYFSFMTDFATMTNAEVFERVGAGAEQIGQPLTKETNKAFTKERTLGEQVIRLNAMEIYTRHIDNAFYSLHIGPDNRLLFEVANTKKFKELLGNKGSQTVLEWLDTMARKGGAQGEQRMRLLDTFRKNVGIAQLGFKLSSALIQPTALFDGASLIGNYAFKGMKNIALSKDWRTFILNNFPEVKARIGDDRAFAEFTDNRTLAKIQKKGFWMLTELDGITASSVAAGAYERYLDQNNIPLDFSKPNKKGIQEAQKLVRRTQASALFKDAPAVITRGAFTGSRQLDQLIFQFQSFMLGRWSIIRHDMVRLGIQQKDFTKAADIAFYLILAGFAEVGLRLLSKEMISWITREEIEFDKDSITRDLALGFIGNVPFVSQGVSLFAYGSNPVPALSIFGGLIRKAAFRLKGKKTETKLKGVVNLLEAINNTMVGLPGSAQLGDILESALDKGTKKKKKLRI